MLKIIGNQIICEFELVYVRESYSVVIVSMMPACLRFHFYFISYRVEEFIEIYFYNITL
jgi:hypothetical protein